MPQQESWSLGPIDVSDPFEIPCSICHGSKYTKVHWGYQPRPTGNKEDPWELKGYIVVEKCKACKGTGKITVVEKLSPNHEHTWTQQEAPSIDNNFQGTLVCKECSIVIMGSLP